MKLSLTLIIALGLLIGCGSRRSIRIIEQQPHPAVQQTQHVVKQSKLPPAPKKKMKLKEVKDTNYNDKYMYPEDTAAAKKDPIKSTEISSTTNNMTKEECISMISQEKFDKYTNMFGSEAASIKRCAMLKAMNK